MITRAATRLCRIVAVVLAGTMALASPAALAQRVAAVSVEEARAAALGGDMVLVDIRTPEEWRETGVADVAVALDMRADDFVLALLALREGRPELRLGLICATGVRSRHVATVLARHGVAGIVDVPAGMMTRDGWLARRLPVRAPDEPARPASPLRQ